MRMRVTTIKTERAPIYDSDGDLVDLLVVDEDIEEVEVESFQELLDLLPPYRSDTGEPDAYTWAHDEGDREYKNGFELGYVREYSVHYHCDNHPKHLKYWIKALKLTTE